MNAILRDVDPEIKAIFDAMLAYMGTEYPTCNCFANYDGMGTNMGINCTDTTGNRWSYTEYQQGVRVTITPTGASLGPGQQQQFTATATNPDGTAVAGATFTWSLQPGAAGSVSSAGLYVAPASIAINGSESLRCQLTGGNSWATMAVSLHP